MPMLSIEEHETLLSKMRGHIRVLERLKRTEVQEAELKVTMEDAARYANQIQLAKVSRVRYFDRKTCDRVIEYWRQAAAGGNGPTGHGDICMSDADPGL